GDEPGSKVKTKAKAGRTAASATRRGSTNASPKPADKAKSATTANATKRGAASKAPQRKVA
ncbi:MAG: hypothetical protein ABI589_07725, partial [Burkholderiales bacterium]